MPASLTPPSPSTPTVLKVQVVLFDGFDPLDVIAPYEVLHAGGQAAGGAMTVELVSAEGPREVVSGILGITLRATSVLDPCADVIVVPGAAGPVEDPDEVGLETIPVLLAATLDTALPALVGAAMAREDTLVATVCGGSLELAMAGLLVDRHAVTHHQGMDVLEATGALPVRARVVEDGRLVTGGGVTSGLDVGLYLLERLLGPATALAVEALFEYERRGTTWHAPGAGAAIGAGVAA